MSNSMYRPSGRRKGTWRTPSELRADQAKSEQVFKSKLDKLRYAYHCPGNEGRCAAAMASLTYGQTRVTKEVDPDAAGRTESNLVAEYDVATATIVCTQGHEQTLVLK